MRAVFCTAYGPPDVLRLADVPKPVVGKGEICVRVRAAAVTASDCIIRRGQARFPMWLFMRAMLGFRRPRRTPGGVFSGEVESVGDGVTRFKAGDAIFGMPGLSFGTYAEYACMKETARFAALAGKPANASHEEAAAIPYGGLLAISFLEPAGVASAKKVLVYGASGSIGTAAVQLSRHFGAEVTGVCGPANLDMVAKLGAARVVDYSTEDSVPAGGPYDLVFDAVGKRKTSKLKEWCATALAPGGRYVSVDDQVAKLDPGALERLRDLVESGELRPVIDRRYRFDEIVEAHRYVEAGHKKGNVVVTVA